MGSQSAPESPSPRSGRRRHPGKEGCGRPHKPQARSDPTGDPHSHRAIPSAPEEGEAHPYPSGITSASQRTSALIYGSPLISTENFFRVRNRSIRGHDSKTYRALWATAGIFRFIGTRKGRTVTCLKPAIRTYRTASLRGRGQK